MIPYTADRTLCKVLGVLVCSKHPMTLVQIALSLPPPRARVMRRIRRAERRYTGNRLRQRVYGPMNKLRSLGLVTGAGLINEGSRNLSKLYTVTPEGLIWFKEHT